MRALTPADAVSPDAESVADLSWTSHEDVTLFTCGNEFWLADRGSAVPHRGHIAIVREFSMTRRQVCRHILTDLGAVPVQRDLWSITLADRTADDGKNGRSCSRHWIVKPHCV